MKAKKAFTMVELMVVILIVGILAAVAVPLMRGRIDSSKWSEGKAGMGTIASALRAYAAEKANFAAACEENERLRGLLDTANEHLAYYSLNDPDPKRSLKVANLLLKINAELEGNDGA